MIGSIPLIARIAALYELVNAALEPTLSECGITSSTFELLSAVQAAGEGATQRQVADRLGIAAASLSESLGAAERAGLILRTVPAEDKRARSLSITPKGKRALDACLEALQRTEMRAAQDISRQERSSLETTLQRMLVNLGG